MYLVVRFGSLVVEKRSTDRRLHTRVASQCHWSRSRVPRGSSFTAGQTVPVDGLVGPCEGVCPVNVSSKFLPTRRRGSVSTFLPTRRVRWSVSQSSVKISQSPPLRSRAAVFIPSEATMLPPIGTPPEAKTSSDWLLRVI